jgi:hypothetical protein
MTLVTFHAGLHKTGSGFLQKFVFPRMTGVQYFNAKSSLPSIVDTIDKRNLLISGEQLSGKPFSMDYRVSRLLSLGNLCSLFPGSQLLIFLREPSSWLDSLYRQHLHQGGRESFVAFSTRYIGDGSLNFYDFLSELHKLPFAATLALDHEDLLQRQNETLDVVRRFVGCRELSMSSVDKKAVHNVGVRNHAASFLLTLNRLTFGRRIGRYWLQRGHLSMLNRTGNDPVPETELSQVRQRFGAEWERAKRELMTVV